IRRAGRFGGAGIRPVIDDSSKAAAEMAYRRALLAELEEIQRQIPRSELAITWDVVHAVLTWEDPGNKYITQFLSLNRRRRYHPRRQTGRRIRADAERPQDRGVSDVPAGGARHRACGRARSLHHRRILLGQERKNARLVAAFFRA